MNRLTLALDVMGGDIGPRITIPASLSALEADPMLSLVLFGDSQQISPLLENAPSSLALRLLITIKVFLMHCVIAKVRRCV